MSSAVPAPQRRRPFTRTPGASRLGGVCAGLAERWDVDPIVLRTCALVLVLSGGIGVVLYATAWLLWPTSDGRPSPLEATAPGIARLPHWLWWAAAAVLVGAVMVLLAPVLPLGPLPALVLLGIVLVGRRQHSRAATPAPAPATELPRSYPPLPVTTPSYRYPAAPPPSPSLPSLPPRTPLPSHPPRPPRRGVVLGLLTFLALTGSLGALGLAQVSGLAVPLPVWGGVMLAVLGASSVIGAFTGPNRPWQVLTVVVALPLATLLCLPAVALTLSDPVHLTPTAADLSAGIDDSVRVVTYDLSGVSLPADGEGHIAVTAGRVILVLPERANAEVTLTTTAGVLELDGRPELGQRWKRLRTGSGPRPYRLSVHVETGSLEVQR